jgi:hypothetical protein
MKRAIWITVSILLALAIAIAFLWYAFTPAENPWPTPPLRGIDGKQGTPARLEPPYMPKIPDREPPKKVAVIATDEVKKREGWTGKADMPEREVHTWYVVVRRDPSTPRGDRVVGIDADTFRVTEYRAFDWGPVP